MHTSVFTGACVPATAASANISAADSIVRVPRHLTLHAYKHMHDVLQLQRGMAYRFYTRVHIYTRAHICTSAHIWDGIQILH